MFEFHEIGDSKVVVEHVSIFLASLKISAVRNQTHKMIIRSGSGVPSAA
jgi:hypothetical protein